MLDFGTTDDHSNRVSYGDVDSFDGSGKYTLCFFQQQRAATPSSSRWAINKGGITSNYIAVRAINVGNGIRAQHHTSAADNVTASAGFPTVGVTYSWAFVYLGGASNNYKIYRDAVSQSMSDDDIAQDVGSSANPITLGGLGSPSSGSGPPVALGHIMFWNGINLTDAEIYQYHSGKSIPQIDKLSFWVKGTTSPGKDEISQNAGSVTGTVGLLSDPCDTYFLSDPYIPPWREAMSRELRRRRFEEMKYSIRVPLEFLVLEILDGLNVSHDSLPRAASILADIEDHYLLEKWRAMFAASETQTFYLEEREIALEFTNVEPFIAYAWSTDILPYAVTDEYDGLAQFDQGAAWHNERTSLAWVEQFDSRIATVPAGVIRMGVHGFFPCAGSENPIKNSTFWYDSGGPPYFPNWTLSASGTFGADTVNLFFVDNDTYTNVIQITKGAGDSYVEQVVAVSTSDVYKVLQLWYRNEEYGASKGTLSYQIYRASGEYWNDATPGWQGGSVWNNLADGSMWSLRFSNPINIPASENWTIRFGIVTGATSTSIEMAQVQLNAGRYLLAPIATTPNGTTTTVDDERYFEFDLNTTEDHRVVSPTRSGTFRLRFRAVNDYDRMADGDELALGCFRADSTDDNRDDFVYEKQSGSNHRFAMKRYRHGTLEATAYKDVQVAAGTEYEVAFRWLYDEFDITPTNNARDLDGTSDYYSLASDLQGNADSDKFIFSCRLRIDGGDGTNRAIIYSAGAFFIVQVNTGNRIGVYAKNSGGTVLINKQSDTTYTNADGELSVLISGDLSGPTLHMYVNDKEDLQSGGTLATGTIDFTRTAWGYGADNGGSSRFNGALSEVQFKPGYYLDFSTESNRRLIFRRDNKPEYMGGDASLVASTPALLYAPSGKGSNNCGIGGNFTENGSPSATGLAGPSRTLSVFVDGVKGTDAQAESNQASHDYDELCPDPTCATDWVDSKGAAWSHDTTDDEYDCDGTQAGDDDITENNLLVSGWVYRVEFEVTKYTAGNVSVVCGTQEGTDRGAVGTYVEYITANGTSFKIRGDINFAGSISNVYIRRDSYNSFHVGSAPSSTGYLPLNNYMANWELVQRAIPDEEIQARR